MTLSHIFETQAIVLKRRNVAETDRIITVFSKEYGRIRVYARGVRRVHSRRSAYLEVFSHTLLILHRGKTWDSVTEAAPIHVFSGLRESLPRVSHAYYLCELVEVLLPERQEHRDVYTLLLNALTALNDIVGVDPVAVSEQFALELLRCLGYLARDRALPSGQIDPYIENIIEKRIRSHRLLTKFVDA
ncbi:MAG: DNA repair protein RecO [Patescibacteria group bacterium]